MGYCLRWLATIRGDVTKSKIAHEQIGERKMTVFFLIVALLTLGGSTAEMATNQAIYTVILTMNDITSGLIGWALLLTVLFGGLMILAFIRGNKATSGCLGCLVVPVLFVALGSVFTWLLTGGMLVNFSPETGPTSILFWVWLLLALPASAS